MNCSKSLHKENIDHTNVFQNSNFVGFSTAEQQQLFLQLFSEKFSAFTSETTTTRNTQNASETIKLNVGGKLFITTKSTLFSVENSLKSMLQSGNFQPDLDGAYFIDRSPEYFPLILDYLRNPTKDLKILSSHLKETRQKIDFQYELDFYCIEQETSETSIFIDTSSSDLILQDFTLTKEKGKYGYGFASERLKMNENIFELSFEFIQVPLGEEVSVFVGLTETEKFGSALTTQQVPKFQITKAKKGDIYTCIFNTKEFQFSIYKNNEILVQQIEFLNSENWFPCIEMDCSKHEKTSILFK